MSEDIEQVEDQTEDEPESEGTAKVSLRKAINEHCKSCGYDPLDKGHGAWREQITACPVTNCAIWPVRPKSKPRKI